MAGELKSTLDGIGDVVGGTMGRMNASGVTSADSFVENAAIGNRYELAAADIAVERRLSGPAGAFAAQMIADHTTSKHHLQAALSMNETQGVAPPPEKLDSRRQAMVKHLREAPDDAFEATYLDQQVLAHEETATLLRSYAEDGDNAQLRSFALGTLPVVERHLQQAKALKQDA